jgi:DNA-damage-inducible protein D
MANQSLIIGPHKDFENIKHIDENGVEYWFGRELMYLLGYNKWENFEIVIKKAQRACIESGQSVENHFPDARKMVQIGSNTYRKVDDWKLDRYACYLIAQNGDSRKTEIALAQTYFVVQTRKQEIFEQLEEDGKRLLVRDEITDENKKLFKTAKAAGVTYFGSFNDAGYRGLYGMPLANIEKKKGIKKGELLDRADSTELAANLFRITQTDEKLRKDAIRGQTLAEKTHNMVGGKVRQTIKDIGGVLPENIRPAQHIRELRKKSKIHQLNSRKKSSRKTSLRSAA